MVVDLQGVVTEDNRIVLTDPAILCADVTKFGHTNLGEEAMLRCKEALELWDGQTAVDIDSPV